MRIIPGSTYIAHIPDFSQPHNEDIDWRKHITIPQVEQRVLAVGNSISNIICLPIYAEESGTAIMPCWWGYYADPYGIFPLWYESFSRCEMMIKKDCREELSSFLRDYFSGMIEKWCVHAYLAHLPQTELQDGVYRTKLRPVVHIGENLYLHCTTNGGEYKSSGCVVTSLGDRPWIVTEELYSFPRTFLKQGLPLNLTSQDRRSVIEMAQKLSWLHL